MSLDVREFFLTTIQIFKLQLSISYIYIIHFFFMDSFSFLSFFLFFRLSFFYFDKHAGLRSIDGLDTHTEVVNDVRIRSWYDAMAVAVGPSEEER